MINVFKAIGHGLSRAWFWYKAQYRGRWYQRIVTPIATFIVLFFLYLRAVDVDFLGLFGKSPDMEIIENPINDEASLIYSADSVLIGKFFNENRSPVQFEEISPYMIDALISTEDERFYLHHGIDYGGLFAAFKDMLKGNARGASTITQQLVKNLFKMRSQYSTGVLGRVPVLKILIMKSKEWITAIKIENLYSKKDILTLYLNTVDFGSNAFGIKTAAKTYFNTTPDQLNPQQCATLVGLLKATTTYNPKVNPKNSLARRNVVLNNMRKYGSLTKQECDSISQLPMDLSYSVENTYDGQAQYFREKLKDYLADWCKENNINLYADGLKIYTTVDTRLQKYAEEAVLKQMRVLQQRFDQHWRGRTPWRDEYGREIPNFIENIAKNSSYYKILEKKYPNQPDSIDFYMNQPHTVKLFTYDTPDRTMECEISTMDSIRYMVRQMHCGFVAMEPQTSFVRAWVGDIDFNAWKYDKVTAMRQPGSTFKLFVYAAAMEVLGLTPTDRRQDSYISIPVTDSKGKNGYWTPHNANGYCTNAYVTLRAAFARSINTIAVKLGQEAGIPYVINMAKRMGIKSKLENLPSLALGASDVTLLELIDAYCCVMNDGMQRDPILVTQIVDREGNIIYNCQNEVPLPKRAMNYRTAFYMQRLLWAGMHEPGGTTQALWEYIHCYDTEFGGKTGTSSNHSDAWFVGCSPYLVGGAWFGGEYRSIHFRTGALGQGSRTALPIFGYFMDKVMHDSNFKHYHGKFPEMKEEILAETYEGDYEDSLEMDSLDYLLSDSDFIYSNYD
ncbi:MAG: transglycosylase domain-containing protein [Bacteroidaceae bacterium]|nr:transglycosylase domain-containing protein [Bacteroidaceae bacterium]